MNYEIHIKDTQQIEEPLVLHFAQRNSISLNWMGGDDKTQPIVGSELNFTLEVGDGEDGKYDNYFTSDEQRFQVTKLISETQEIVWRGFLLPESYSEPYEYPLFYVNFSAVDGLGLLKGKKLPTDFYSEEKIVTDVIAAALKLTGIDFDIYLAPAIRNRLKQYWHEIFLDTKKYYKEDKLPSAYDLLEETIFSMRCQLFQADGRWYVEGINRRQLISLSYSKYDINGTFLADVQHEKNVKVLSFAPTPNITMVPPFKEVIVTHEAAQLQFPEDIVSYNPDFTAVNNTNINYYHSKYWDGNSGYYPATRVKDNYLFLADYSMNGNFDPARKISLREKIYVLKDWKVRISMQIELYGISGVEINGLDEDQRLELRDYAVFRILLNDQVIYYNLNSQDLAPERLSFNASGKAEIEIDFTVSQNGFLGVEFYEPYKENDIANAYIVRRLNIENRYQKEDEVYIVSIDENASQTNEIDLEISSDVSLLSKSFYLEKTRERTATGATNIPVNIYSTFQFEGDTYYVTDVLGAFLVGNHLQNVKYTTASTGSTAFSFSEVEVFFNFQEGDDFVFRANLHSASHSPSEIRVRYQKLKEPSISRDELLKWSDDIYQIEQKPYAQVVAEIEQRLYLTQHLRIEGEAHNPVKFNDIIRFKWQGENKYFSLTNCQWQPDDNLSSITLVESAYSGSGFGNLPPYVDAGDDAFLINSYGNIESFFETTAYANNTAAFDPDGSIASLVWEKLEGDAGDVIEGANTLNPTFQNLTGNYYKYRLTVVDNSGAVASDTMEINRRVPFEIGTTSIDGGDYVVGEYLKEFWYKYKITLSPDFPTGVSVNLLYDVLVKYISELAADVYVILEKNGISYMWRITKQPNEPAEFEEEGNGVLSLRQGDEVFVTVYTRLQVVDHTQLPANATAQIVFTGYNITAGFPILYGIPLNVELYTELG